MYTANPTSAALFSVAPNGFFATAAAFCDAVKSWGTEGRLEGNQQIPASNHLHGCVNFRGEDIKDLHVHEVRACVGFSVSGFPFRGNAVGDSRAFFALLAVRVEWVGGLGRVRLFFLSDFVFRPGEKSRSATEAKKNASFCSSSVLYPPLRCFW